jgi:flagellar M-ring protein FliF
MAEVMTLPAEVKRALFIRQAGFLIAIAASVAIAVYVTLWSRTPNFSLLYGSLSHRDVAEVLEALQKANIDYKVEEASGAVMVPSSKVHEARMKLAADGLPGSANAGFGMLKEDQGLGTSQFIEKARYQHALESELVKSITEISAVKNARVHLAIPKQSVFVRNRKPVSASVLVDLYSGHRLSEEQTAAISNLVAASVPNLENDNVSIIDQNGRLLTHAGMARDYAMSAAQFQYARRVEDSYIKRIEDILFPVLGQDGVNAQVTADFDFTSTEQTRESYNPDLPAVRSEQVEEEMLGAGTARAGVPGALSNQPPQSGSVPETTDGSSGETAAAAGEQSAQTNVQRRTVRNYELDKTISHTRMPVGSLRSLSVAVVIDYKKTVDENGNVSYVEHSPEELERITSLVREAIGFNPARGDKVHVMNTRFMTPDQPEALPESPIWQQAWIWDAGKQAAGAMVVLFLIFGVLKPALKNLLNKEITLHQSALAMPNGAPALTDNSNGNAQDQLAAGGSNQAQLSAPTEYDSTVDAVKELVKGDPKTAATVVKNWVGEE